MRARLMMSFSLLAAVASALLAAEGWGP